MYILVSVCAVCLDDIILWYMAILRLYWLFSFTFYFSHIRISINQSSEKNSKKENQRKINIW